MGTTDIKLAKEYSHHSTVDHDYERQFDAMGGRREQQHARTPHELIVARLAVGLVIVIMLGVVVASRQAW